MKKSSGGLCTALACVMVLLSSPCRGQAIPPPGQYRVDTTATFRWVDPSGVTERIEQSDGVTGQTTVTTTTPSASKPVVTVYPGSGPHHECQATGAPIVAGNCVAKLETHGDVASSAFTCQGLAQEVVFQKVAAGVWEKRLKSAPAPGAKAPGLTPQVAAAMAPVIEKMEARARVAPPDEAAALRQQVAAIRRGGAPASSNGPEVKSVQRWTFMSNHCAGK
jgi:hypothetical protein